MQAILAERAHLHPEDPPRIPQSKEKDLEKQQIPRVPQKTTNKWRKNSKSLGRRPPADVKKLPSRGDNCYEVKRQVTCVAGTGLQHQIADVSETKATTLVVHQRSESAQVPNWEENRCLG